MNQDKIEIVDNDDNVIGIEYRDKVHEEGLLHREIHVWFFTPNRELILQHRAKDKDTYPDKLDATVGGHVEPNDSYEETAIKESKEETGIDLDQDKLIVLRKMHKKAFDKDTNKINNTIRTQYAYLYEGQIDDLQVEEGKAEGFEVWKLEDLYNLDESIKERFIPIVISEEFLNLFKEAEEKLFN